MSIPKITEHQVQGWFDTKSFKRGKTYYRSGNILQPKLQGAILKSQCMGSSSSPYRVQITVDQGGEIVSTRCSCPLGGNCKHCVALLLQWVNLPDSFSRVEDLADALAKRSKEELIKLIVQMVDKNPELERLIEISALSSSNIVAPLDQATIQRQIMGAIQDAAGDEYDYYGALDLSGLDIFVELIKDYSAAGQWFNAATVSMSLIETLLQNYDQLYDEEGYVYDYVNEGVDHLEITLANLENSEERTAVLKALFDVEAWDTDFGGIDMGYRAKEIMLAAINPQERELIIQWTRDKLASVPDEKYSTDFKRSAYGGLLLELEKDSLDDEDYIRICRESGRTADLIERLLTLNRISEAVQEASKVESHSILDIADRFVRHNVEEVIIPTIQDRASRENRRHIYSRWLKDRAMARGDTASALSILKDIFDNSPNLNNYVELASLGKQRNEWELLRTQVMAQLQESEHYSLLTEIHIHEKNIDNALQTIDLIKRPGNRFAIGYNTTGLKLKLAAAAEESHPNASIRFYLEIAERLIDARGRGNYSEAARYLRKARHLYQQQDLNNEWLELIRHIRVQNRALRAMQDEFNQAGLEQ